MKQLRKLLPLMLVLVLMLGLAVAASAEGAVEDEAEYYGFGLNGLWYSYDTEQDRWCSWDGIGEGEDPAELPEGVTFEIKNGCCLLTLNNANLTGATWFEYEGYEGDDNGTTVHRLPCDSLIIYLIGDNSITTTSEVALGLNGKLCATIMGEGSSLTITAHNETDNQKDGDYYYPVSAVDMWTAKKFTVESGNVTIKVDGNAKASWDEEGEIHTESAELTAVNGNNDVNLVVSGGKLTLVGDRGVNFGEDGGILIVTGGELTMPGGYVNAVYSQTGGTVNVTGVCNYEAPEGSEENDYWEGLNLGKAFKMTGGTLNINVRNGNGTWGCGMFASAYRISGNAVLNVTVGAGEVLAVRGGDISATGYYEQTGGTVTLKNTNPEDPMGLTIGTDGDAWPGGSAVQVSGGKLTVYGGIDVYGYLEITGGEVEAGPCPGVDYAENLWRGTICAPNNDDFLLSSIKVSGGKLTATTIAGDAWAMYVGGRYEQTGGEVTLNGMNGANALECSGFITVENGKLTATSDEGCGCHLYREGKRVGHLTVNGGEVNFTGLSRGLRILDGSSVVLNNGQLNATGCTAVFTANWCCETVWDGEGNSWEEAVYVTNPEDEKQGSWVADLENPSSLTIHGGTHTFKGVVPEGEEYAETYSDALYAQYSKIEIDGGTLHLKVDADEEEYNRVLDLHAADEEGYFTLGSKMRVVCNAHNDEPVLRNEYVESYQWMEEDYYPTYWMTFTKDNDPVWYHYCTDVTIEEVSENHTHIVAPKTENKTETPAVSFSDVKSGDWFYDSVMYVCENGLMNGTGNGQFSPNANTTRGMIVTVLARLEGVDTTTGSSWYEAGRQWAMKNGISDGTNMDGQITREQLATMLYRYAQLKGYDVSARADLSSFADANSVSDWAQDAMQWAVAKGLIEGSDNQLTPAAPATRAQIATILMRFVKKVVK